MSPYELMMSRRPAKPEMVEFYRDVYPILRRPFGYTVNSEAHRGHDRRPRYS